MDVLLTYISGVGDCGWGLEMLLGCFFKSMGVLWSCLGRCWVLWRCVVFVLDGYICCDTSEYMHISALAR